jgi:hypothetical protein
MNAQDLNSGGRVPGSNLDLAVITEGFRSNNLKQGKTEPSGLYRPAHSVFMSISQCCPALHDVAILIASFSGQRMNPCRSRRRTDVSSEEPKLMYEKFLKTESVLEQTTVLNSCEYRRYNELIFILLSHQVHYRRRIFGPKRDEVTSGWRKLHNEELHGL